MADKEFMDLRGGPGEHGPPALPSNSPPHPPSGGWGREVGRGGRGLQPLAPSPNTLLATLPLAPGRAALVWGEQLRYVAAAAAAWGVGRGVQVLVVDAANRFDPYALVRQARRRGLSPQTALCRVQVARAFTCHQLVRLLEKELAPRLLPGSLVVVLGPVSLFYDEQVPLPERRRLFQEVVRHLAAVKSRQALLLLQPLLPQGVANHHFGKMLAPLMDYLVRMEEIAGRQGARGVVPGE